MRGVAVVWRAAVMGRGAWFLAIVIAAPSAAAAPLRTLLATVLGPWCGMPTGRWSGWGLVDGGRGRGGRRIGGKRDEG